jgi:hypothetical protein
MPLYLLRTVRTCTGQDCLRNQPVRLAVYDAMSVLRMLRAKQRRKCEQSMVLSDIICWSLPWAYSTVPSPIQNKDRLLNLFNLTIKTFLYS